MTRSCQKVVPPTSLPSMTLCFRLWTHIWIYKIHGSWRRSGWGRLYYLPLSINPQNETFYEHGNQSWGFYNNSCLDVDEKDEEICLYCEHQQRSTFRWKRPFNLLEERANWSGCLRLLQSFTFERLHKHTNFSFKCDLHSSNLLVLRLIFQRVEGSCLAPSQANSYGRCENSERSTKLCQQRGPHGFKECYPVSTKYFFVYESRSFFAKYRISIQCSGLPESIHDECQQYVEPISNKSVSSHE